MYIPLFNKTNYNLLSSLLKIDELVQFAKEKNLQFDENIGNLDRISRGSRSFLPKNMHFVLQKERESGKIKKIVFVRSPLGWAGG